MANVLRVDSAGDLPFVDAEENVAEGVDAALGGCGKRADERADERAEAEAEAEAEAGGSGRRRRGSSRRPSHSPEQPLPAPPRTSVASPARPTINVSRGNSPGPGSSEANSPAPSSPLAGSRKGSVAGSRKGSVAGSRKGSAAGSRPSSRRGSRTLLDVGREATQPPSRRGSRATDLAEVVIAELRRPSRRSSRAVALELGEVLSVEVRRHSRSSARHRVEEVTTSVRRQSVGSRGARPSLLTHLGGVGGVGASASGSASSDGHSCSSGDSDAATDAEAAASFKSSPVFLDQSSRVPQYVAAIVVNLASFCSGLTIGWPSVAIPLLQSPLSPVVGGSLSDEEASWLAASTMLSALFAMPAWIVVNDRYGRKGTGFALGLTFALHWLLLGVTRSAVCLFCARVFGGVGAAGVFAVCPVYVKEVAEDAIRGQLGFVGTIMFNLGVLVAYSVGAVMSYKGVNILGIAFVLLFIVSFWQLPESPVFLLSKGKGVRAARALQWLRGKGADVLDELTALRANSKRQREEGDASLWDVVGDRASRKGILITTVICANQPLCGLPVVLSFTVNIFMEAGDAVSPYMATVLVGLLLLLSAYFASYCVDHLGRKILLIVSNIGMAVCLFALGIFFYIKHIGVDVKSIHIGWIPVTSLSLFVFFVSLGVAPLPFVIMTEIFLPQAQRIASTIGYCIIWFLSFIATKFFANIAVALGIYSCYWIFAIVCVLCAVFSHVYVPETKGRSLESILDELSAGRQLLKHKDDEESDYC